MVEHIQLVAAPLIVTASAISPIVARMTNVTALAVLVFSAMGRIMS